MQLLQDFLDRSKQLHRAPIDLKHLAYHGPQKQYKIIHQSLIIADLPAPLHYLNFFSLIGQPNAPSLCNSSCIQTHALDTATVIASCSAHMAGQLNHYNIADECNFQDQHFVYGQREQVFGALPHLRIQRSDSELSFDLDIKSSALISHLNHLRFGLAQHWSVLCYCHGTLEYKNQKFAIDHMGSFEYARSINFPYLPFAFYSYQLLQLSQNRQLLLMHIRDRFDRIIQSRMYYRDLNTMQSYLLDQNVHFEVHRVYPRLITPNGQNMYLAREFEWHCKHPYLNIHVHGQSRGDYKFGLGAGFVGSFQYQVRINDEHEYGESGYCEYVDCRDLCFQEQTEHAAHAQQSLFQQAFVCKK